MSIGPLPSSPPSRSHHFKPSHKSISLCRIPIRLNPQCHAIKMPHLPSSLVVIFVAFLGLLSMAPNVNGIACRKERIGPLGMNDFRGGMNVDCGQYVQHCIKVQMWDNSIIRDCDPLALCPKDGNKMISRAEYYCCMGDLCNGSLRHHRSININMVALTSLMAILSSAPSLVSLILFFFAF